MTQDQQEMMTLAVSDQELERRWNAARTRMKEERIDVLVMQDTNEWLGGYVKWFTDVPARNGYPMTVVFPVDDRMTTVTNGGKPPGDPGPPAWQLRGVKNRLTDPAEIWNANNEFLASRGHFPETRLYAHGQGYDLVERPTIRDDEPMKLAANMNIVVHPGIRSDRVWTSVCDNYLITETGVSPCLHKTPQKIFSV